MIIPHAATVAVADGRKFLLFRNEGDADQVNLVVEAHTEQADPASRDINSDKPGTAVSGVGGVRSGVDGGDPHQHNEDVFAAAVAERLHRLVDGGHVKHLFLVAPPRALGVIRKHLHKNVIAVIAGELHKELTNQTPDQIAHAIGAA